LLQSSLSSEGDIVRPVTLKNPPVVFVYSDF
jgi:hypothetical protein